MRQTPVAGDCDPRFAPVRDAFAAQLAEQEAGGAALAVTVGGAPVVDLWGGFTDAQGTSAWERDTIVNVASSTKGAVAVVAHLLAERGTLDLGAPVASVWPEFAAAGKEAIPVSDLLSHRAGLPAIREPVAPGVLFNWDRMAGVLAAEAPWWEPGTRHGYHVVTFGHLVGEVVRRLTGRSFGAVWRDEIAAPRGLDLHVGLPASEDARVAETIQAPPTPEVKGLFEHVGPDSLLVKAFSNPPEMADPAVINTEQWRRAEIPAANGHGNARALAGLYAALLAGEVLAEATLAEAIAERSRGVDAVLGLEDAFSLGFMLPSPMRPFGRNERVFGHSGAGGSLGFADLDAGVALGFSPSHSIVAGAGGDPRWPALLDAVYGAL
jgi:CubicO group peptidase (beta-lactamase class C family)